tara:strand:+ start:1789 stop:2259 length:471 start_codon:yes stop_codon:yes gene_type:complete
MINDKDLNDACNAWGDGIILISKTYDEKGINEATVVAKKILQDLYAFELGPILFKPTLSGGNQTFRSNLEGALSYFVGNNPKYPLDKGFGIKSWNKFDFKTSETFKENDIAIWMGSVTFTNKNGDILKVDKSLAYKKLSNGNLKIVLHHSSLPYKI